MSSGHAHTVGLLPVFGACSINLNSLGFPGLSPVDSTSMSTPPKVNHAVRLGADAAGTIHPSPAFGCSRTIDH